MSRRCNSYNKRIFMLILALQLILHVTLSNDNPFWCGKVENEASDVWIGHNFSKSFYLKDPILDSQILVWTKGNSTWVKRNANPLKYMDGGNYSHTRYRITKVSNVSYDLFIDYADQNDTGHHVVTVNLGKQSLCTALMMNLTVNTPEPLCSSRLNKSDGKLQMSCQWVQMNKGDRAHFEVEREVLYEHQIQEVNFDGTFNVTHKFSVNIGLDRVVDEITVPPRCVVSQKRGKVTEMCEFLEVRSYPLTYTQNKNVEFKCCTRKPSIPLSLIYDCYGKELGKSLKRYYTTNKDNCTILFFLCGANEEHNSNMTEIKIEQIDLRRLVKYEGSRLSIEVGEPEHDNEHDNASEDKKCELMTVKVTSPDRTLNNQDGTSTDSDNSKNDVSSHSAELDLGTTPTHNPGRIATKYRRILIVVAAIAASVLAFFTGACITKCYYMYSYSPGKHYDLVRRDTASDPQNSPPAAEDDAGNLAMTTTQIPQQDDVVASQGLVFQQQQPTDEEVQYFKRETKESCLAQPKLTDRREMSHDSGGCSEVVKRNPHPQNASAANARKIMPDSTYCSVDDVENMPSNTKEQEMSSKNRSCLPASRQDIIRNDWKGTNLPIPDLDQLYAKPDMSRKTKNKASLESAYDDPRPPAENLFASILVQNDRPLPILNTDHAFHVYGNAITSPTDESTTGDELYINAHGQDMF